MFGGRKFSINRHTGVPKPFAARRFSNAEPGSNGMFLGDDIAVLESFLRLVLLAQYIPASSAEKDSLVQFSF